MSYEIVYVNTRSGPSEPLTRTAPIKFSDRESALAAACHLLRTGIFVEEIHGPDFKMSRKEIESHFRAQKGRGSRYFADARNAALSA